MGVLELPPGIMGVLGLPAGIMGVLELQFQHSHDTS